MEKSKYGWFWECPNGERCIYRHALPNGYVLKRDKKKLEDKGEEISLVDLIESERNALGSHTVSLCSNISNNLITILRIYRPKSRSNRSCRGRNVKSRKRKIKWPRKKNRR